MFRNESKMFRKWSNMFQKYPNMFHFLIRCSTFQGDKFDTFTKKIKVKEGQDVPIFQKNGTSGNIFHRFWNILIFFYSKTNIFRTFFKGFLSKNEHVTF